MRYFVTWCLAAIAIAGLPCLRGEDGNAQSGKASAVDAKGQEYSGDNLHIDFFVPGEFKEALKHAKEINRCLLIKGIAFGVDDGLLHAQFA